MENRGRKKYQQLDDEALTRLAKQGENPAFDILLGRYRSLIKRYLLSLIVDPNAAEDIPQDTFIKIYTSIHQYRQEASFKGWLFVIARNINRCISIRMYFIPSPKPSLPEGEGGYDANTYATINKTRTTGSILTAIIF